MLRRRRLFYFTIFMFISISMLINISLWSLRGNDLKRKSESYCRTAYVQPVEKFYTNLIHIPKLNIIYCDVPKAASTNLRRLVYAYLYPSKSLINLDRKRVWVDQKDLFNQFYLKHKSILNCSESTFKFLFVRHPFRRIYSAYHDKFVNDHIEDTLYGWKQLEEDILVQMNKNETLLTIRRRDLRLDFRTFLLYIIDSIRKKRTMNSHWEQIARRCALCLIHYNWIGKVENLATDGKYLVKKLNENTNLSRSEFPAKETDEQGKQTHRFNDIELFDLFRNTVQNDNDFQLLVNYYAPDFKMFNYILPHLDNRIV